MKTAIQGDREATTEAAAPSGHRSDAVVVGVLAFLLSVSGAGRPSWWPDEAATISSATGSLDQLRSVLVDVDGVHGLYYLLMHAWLSVFPATEFWARVPSALLIGGAAAGVVVLGAALSTRSVAVAAGIAFSVLPRTTWAGVEARSYALSMFDAVWLTVLCVVAVRRDKVWIWAVYGLGLVLATVGNAFMVFVVAAHVVVLLGCGRSRRTVAGFGVTVTAAYALVAPFLMLIMGQQKQVAWIPPVGPGTAGQILGDQYFPAVHSDSAGYVAVDATGPVAAEMVSAALHAWARVLPLILVVALLAVAAVRRRHGAGVAIGDNPRLLIWLAAVWIVVPTAVLVGYSAVREPLYHPEYLAFTAPALALLIGLAVVTVGREPRRVAVLLVVLVAAAVPNYLAQRGQYAKFGHDYSAIADLVDSVAAPGDCLNIDTTAAHVAGLTAAQPDAFAGLHDYGSGDTRRSWLLASRTPVTAWADKLATCPVLWTISDRDSSLPPYAHGMSLSPGPRLEGRPAYQIPATLGFRVVERWQFNLNQVVKSVRVSSTGSLRG